MAATSSIVVDLRAARTLEFSHAHMIAEKMLKLFYAGEFDVCTLVLCRIQIGDLAEADGTSAHSGERSSGGKTPDLGGAIYDAEPDEGEILADLLPRNIGVQIFRALLENAASEQGARMSAMDNATRNAGDMINKLTLKYNRQRQAQITKELIEIISGAEAL